MGEHSYSSMGTRAQVDSVLNSEFVREVERVAADRAAATPEIQKRLNSCAALANMVLQALTVFIGISTDLPLWAIGLISAVMFLAEIIVQATTKTPVTNNVVKEITDEAAKKVAAGVVPSGFDVVAPPLGGVITENASVRAQCGYGDNDG